MDCNHNRITSVEQFREELQGLLHRARLHLERDDGLANVVLMSGRPTSRQLLLLGSVPSDLANQRLKQEVQHGSYESVIFIGLALATAQDTGGEAKQVYRATSNLKDLGSLDNAMFCIVVEGSHRDLGTHAAHWEFRREGEKRFEFGAKHTGELSGGVVADLWPKRRLNA